MYTNDIGDIFNKKSGIRKEMPKLFFVMEGAQTEPIYFELNKNKFANPIILTIRSEKKGNNEGSDPEKMIENIEKTFNQSSRLPITFSCLLNYVVNDCFTDEFKKEVSKNMLPKATSFVRKKINKGINDVCTEEEKKLFINKLSELLKIHELIEIDCSSIVQLIDEELTYDPDNDSVCLVFDRDRHGITKAKFNRVLKRAAELNVETYVTNPCFEFWLYLHHGRRTTKVQNASLLKNSYVSIKNKERYSYKLLKQVDKNFKKNGPLDPVIYSRYDKAIRLLSNYETDLSKLENKIGSNLSELFERHKK